MSDIGARLLAVKTRIERAAQSAGRDPSTVRLVAVSKGQPATQIREAYAQGQRIFGENYAQELVTKASELADLTDLEWHMIGHLQSNKARAIAPIAALTHAVDANHLVMELGRRASNLGRRLDVLIEVNVAGDPKKSGCSPSELEPLIAVARGTAGIRLCGLMTMPPFTEEPSGARKYFSALRSLQTLCGGAEALPELSMGMSHDFEIAIEEGATLVRVGTSIFGPRAGVAG